VLSTSVGYTLEPGKIVGVEVGGSLINYDHGLFSDGKQWNAGLFYENQASEYIHFRLSGGYTVFTLNGVPALNTNVDYSGVYGQLGISHRLNSLLQYTLSGGRSINYSFAGGSTDVYFVNWTGTWNLIRDISTSTTILFEHGKQLAGVIPEHFDHFGAGITLGKALTRKLTGSIGYQFYWRGSDLPGRNYVVNLANLNLGYQF
jgi:hypothetical protein